MLSGQEMLNRIQKNLEVPWQSQRADGFSDGILFGSADTSVSGIATTFTPTLEVLRKAVASGKNTIVCREAPFYSRGERCPGYFREGTVPPKDLTDKDAVCRVKRDFITDHSLIIVRFSDNWDARETDGQLAALARALSWMDRHAPQAGGAGRPLNLKDTYYDLPAASLNDQALSIQKSLKLRSVRVIGNPQAQVQKVALTHGLLLVDQIERILDEPAVDVIVAGDTVEWEGAPYFQDLVTAGLAKGIILIGDEASEEPGSGEVATWLSSFIHEVPVEWIPAGEPFWTLSHRETQ
jgi:putative NIF3 family GTP cyclohydrolase 1 type 2